ncbi:MAG: outer membrane lipoprotein carrier protein LolA [Bacteroidota bacterium]
MKRFSTFLLLALWAVCGLAQSSQAVEENDPAARAILDAIKNKYEAYNSLDVHFTLTIAFPEEDPEIQKGHISQQGEKYKLDLEGQSIISDGQTMWFHLKNRNEVQINDVMEDEEDELLSPKNLLRIYENEEFFYALVGEVEEAGTTVQKIEFKPLDRDSEYSKMRLSINKKTQEIIRIKTFAKDGSRYVLQIDQLTPNKRFTDDYFQFDVSQYPGLHVENLRN